MIYAGGMYYFSPIRLFILPSGTSNILASASAVVTPAL